MRQIKEQISIQKQNQLANQYLPRFYNDIKKNLPTIGDCDGIDGKYILQLLPSYQNLMKKITIKYTTSRKGIQGYTYVPNNIVININKNLTDSQAFLKTLQHEFQHQIELYIMIILKEIYKGYKQENSIDPELFSMILNNVKPQILGQLLNIDKSNRNYLRCPQFSDIINTDDRQQLDTHSELWYFLSQQINKQEGKEYITLSMKNNEFINVGDTQLSTNNPIYMMMLYTSTDPTSARVYFSKNPETLQLVQFLNFRQLERNPKQTSIEGVIIKIDMPAQIITLTKLVKFITLSGVKKGNVTYYIYNSFKRSIVSITNKYPTLKSFGQYMNTIFNDIENKKPQQIPKSVVINKDNYEDKTLIKKLEI